MQFNFPSDLMKCKLQKYIRNRKNDKLIKKEFKINLPPTKAQNVQPPT